MRLWIVLIFALCFEIPPLIEWNGSETDLYSLRGGGFDSQRARIGGDIVSFVTIQTHTHSMVY